MSEIDIIVLDVDGGAMLEECLQSLRRQTIPARVIVFDNGSRLPVAERIHDAEVHRSDRNLGFTGGANAALRFSSAEYVALVNNDAQLDSDWLASVRDALDRDERLGAVQTIVRRADGAIDGAGIDIGDGTFRQIGHGLPVGSLLTVPFGVSATATLYRRTALGDHFFDDRLFAYYEDVELSARLRRAGWRVAVLPVVKVTHHGSRSAPLLGRRALQLRTRNRYFVARLHPGVGRVRSLLWEDVKLLVRGRSSIKGVWEGLTEHLE